MVGMAFLAFWWTALTPSVAWSDTPNTEPLDETTTASTPAPEAKVDEPATEVPDKVTPQVWDRVYHEPPVRAFVGERLDIVVKLGDIATVGQLTLAWRPLGEVDWRVVGFDRSGDVWVAHIPGADVQRPGIEYTIQTQRDGARPRARFATSTNPYVVYVAGDSTESVERAWLKEYDGHRSRFKLSGSGVSFGHPNDFLGDSQWDIAASYLYRPLQTLHELEFGFARTRGQAISTLWPDQTEYRLPAGYDRGRASAVFNASRNFGLRTVAEIGANLEQFTAGGGGGIRIGAPTETHVWLWYESVFRVGQTAGLSMTWDTVPHVPMTAGLEVTTWPVSVDWATRLLYGVSLPAGDQLSLDLGLSYQARNALGGGPGAKLGVAWSF